MKMLIDFGLIPDDYDLEKRVYNFNKYIKKMKLDSEFFGLDNIAFEFYSKHFDIDKLLPCEDTESGFKIRQTAWDIYYQRHMDIIRPFVQKLKKLYPEKQIVMQDERFTSVLAQRTILEAGIHKKARQNKALVDEVSATIILESYLNRIKR